MPAAEAPTQPSIALLYSEHHTWLCALLKRRLGDAADAADLAHDAFIRLLLKPRHFDSGEGARAYLCTMARGLCADLWRRRAVEQAWLDTLATQPEAQACSAEHSVLVIQTLCEIDAMLARLPDKAARAFVLALGCGMTDKEVAAELNVSDRMVRKYMAQAMLHCMLLEAARTLDPHV